MFLVFGKDREGKQRTLRIPLAVLGPGDADGLTGSSSDLMAPIGTSWHKRKQRVDRARVTALEHGGWRVIRARQEPLSALARNDVVVPPRDMKEAANRVLKQIREVLQIKIPGLAAYLHRKTLLNEKLAEQYIGRLLEDRLQVRKQ